MTHTALLDVRMFPWRPRARVLKPDKLRDGLDPFIGLGDDLSGLVIGLALWLVVLVAAPLIVLVLAAALLSVELPVVAGIAVLLVLVRFTGLLPWEIVVIDNVTGTERRERRRSLWRAVRSIREVNGDRRVRVRWAWS